MTGDDCGGTVPPRDAARERESGVSGEALRAAPGSRRALAPREPVGLAFFSPPAQPEPTPRAVESGKVRFNATQALRPARRSRAEGLD